MHVDYGKGLDGTYNVCLPDDFWVVGKFELAEWSARDMAEILNRLLRIMGEEAFARAQRDLIGLLDGAYTVGWEDAEYEGVTM